MHSAADNNTKLAAELRGQIIHVPNMLELLPNWPSGGRNKYYQRLRNHIDKILDNVAMDDRRRQAFKESDFAMFCSIWWPLASWERLLTGGIFTLWAFVWDDTVDTNEDELAHSFKDACAFRKQSIEHARYWLGLEEEAAAAEEGEGKPNSGRSSFTLARIVDNCFTRWITSPWTKTHLWPGYISRAEPPCPDAASAIFKQFGQRACLMLDEGQRRRYLKEMANFMDACEQEQAERLADSIPAYDEYIKLRLGTTAARIFFCLSEIPLETRVPDWIMDSKDMKTVWDESNMGITIINDILSLKKELATDCVINAVSCLYRDGKPLSETITYLCDELASARDRLDAAAARVAEACEKQGSSAKVQRDVLKFIDECRVFNTGTVEFTIYAKRYRLAGYVNDDGSLDIVL